MWNFGSNDTIKTTKQNPRYSLTLTLFSENAPS